MKVLKQLMTKIKSKMATNKDDQSQVTSQGFTNLSDSSTAQSFESRNCYFQLKANLMFRRNHEHVLYQTFLEKGTRKRMKSKKDVVLVKEVILQIHRRPQTVRNRIPVLVAAVIFNVEIQDQILCHQRIRI